MLYFFIIKKNQNKKKTFVLSMSHYNNKTRVTEDCRGSVRKVAGNNIYLFNRVYGC